jgi:hydroxyacylglutathione hydrolase
MSATDTSASTREVAERYFGAVTARDVEAMCACWKPGSPDNIIGMVEMIAPDGVRDFFNGLFAAFPDADFQVLDMTDQDGRCAVQWRMRATFTGAPFQGLDPTGARVEMLGCDVVHAEDGLLVRNDAYIDNAEFARQLGANPPQGSKQEAQLLKAVNLKTRLASKVCAPAEQIAEGAWIVRGGVPRKGFNVYFVRDGDGVAMFDAGIKAMTNGLATAGAELGGITRIVLGHAHEDHRGAAPGLSGVPVFCHPDDKADAEGDGGRHYMDISKVGLPARWLYPSLLSNWDGGPVEIAGTVSEGDRVGDFEVIHFPGHAPGLIGLWRESDRLAIVSDTFYTANPETFRPGPPIVPHRAFNQDTEQARQSMLKLAAMEPAAAWPGHAEPLTGDVRSQLERAAAGG